jgi:hypothetical protein
LVSALDLPHPNNSRHLAIMRQGILCDRRDAALAPEMPYWSQVAIDAAVKDTRAVFCDSLIA